MRLKFSTNSATLLRNQYRKVQRGKGGGMSQKCRGRDGETESVSDKEGEKRGIRVDPVEMAGSELLDGEKAWEDPDAGQERGMRGGEEQDTLDPEP
jgi:hypothetical protein